MEAEHLGDPVAQPPVVAVEGREAPEVDPHEVRRRLALDDPLGQRAPRAAGGRDADRVEAGPDEEPVEPGRLPHEELVVGRERLGPVVELADAGVGEGRDPQQRLVHEHREVVPVLLEELELERVRDRVRRAPRLRLGLEAADDEPADLLLEVGPAVGVPQDRQVRVDALHRLGHHVEVLRRVQRHRDAHLVPERLGPLPRAVDDHLGLDAVLVPGPAPVDPHPRDPPAPGGGGRVDPGHPRPLDDARAALPRPLGERHREVGRVDLPVPGQPDRTEQVTGRRSPATGRAPAPG